MQSLFVYRQHANFLARERFGEQSLTSTPDAAEAIQHALDRAAADGGRVCLEPGDFLLDRPLQLPAGVCFEGAGRGSRLIVTRRNVEGVGIHGQRAHGATVARLSIGHEDDGGGDVGLLLTATGQAIVEDVTVLRFGGCGIAIRDACLLCRVTGCVAAGNRHANFQLQRLERGGPEGYGDFIPSIVTGCLAVAGGTGFDVDQSLVINFVGCVAYQSADVGFHLHNVSNSVLLSGCRTFQVGTHGVLVEDTDEVNLTGNIFCWHEREGIKLVKAKWGAITGNNVIDSGSYNPGGPDAKTRISQLDTRPPSCHGIALHEVLGHTVTGNAIFNWPVCPIGDAGVYEDERCADNTIVANNVNFFTDGTRHDTVAPADQVANTDQPDCHHWRYHPKSPEHDKIIQSFETHLTERFIAEVWGVAKPIL